MQKDKFIGKMNKKGEVSETMTWVFATIVILVLVFLFLFAVNLMGQERNLNFGFKTEDSGVSNQEMLFAILNKEVNGKTIKELIINGNNEIAKGEVDKILNDFSYYNVKCDFYTPGFNIKKGGSGTEVTVYLGSIGVSLKC